MADIPTGELEFIRYGGRIGLLREVTEEAGEEFSYWNEALERTDYYYVASTNLCIIFFPDTGEDEWIYEWQVDRDIELTDEERQWWMIYQLEVK